MPGLLIVVSFFCIEGRISVDTVVYFLG